MSTTTARSWFPGLFVPVRNITGIEVLRQDRVTVQLTRGTLHGSPAELRGLAQRMLAAAALVDGAAPRA